MAFRVASGQMAASKRKLKREATSKEKGELHHYIRILGVGINLLVEPVSPQSEADQCLGFYLTNQEQERSYNMTSLAKKVLHSMLAG